MKVTQVNNEEFVLQENYKILFSVAKKLKRNSIHSHELREYISIRQWVCYLFGNLLFLGNSKK